MAFFRQADLSSLGAYRRTGFTGLVALFGLVFALLAPAHAQAQSVANGLALWNSGALGCFGCHGVTPALPQRNAGNAVSVLNSAIVNNSGGVMGLLFRSTTVDGGANGATPLNASDRADLAAYIGSVISTTHSPNPSVNFGGSVAIPFLDVRATTSSALPASTIINSVATTAGPVGGTVSYNLVTSTATYTHTATNCSNGSFSYGGTGLSGSATTSRAVTITVNAPTAPTVSASTANIAYNSGAAIAIPLTLGGGTANSLIVGALSGGAGTLNASGTSLTYTASATTYAASQTFSVQAVGPCANSAPATITLNVATPPAPVITSAASTTGTGGQAFSFNVTASNAPTSFAATGLPTGLSINTTTGAITGTPTVSGAFTAMVTATGPGGTSAAQALSINIGLATPVITSALTASGTSGAAFTYTITANNLPASFNATGLPTGLNINTTTGVISGTPVVAVGGPVNITISATNTAGTDTETLVLTISLSAPTITSAATASGTVGSPFTFSITATDFPSSYAATGLPAGLAINTTTGVISGTPTTAGTSNVNVSATNGSGTANQVLVITVVLLPPTITSAATATGTTTVAFSYQITGSNSPTSYSATGLPAGLSINTTTGLISGTPTAAGTSSVTIGATNASGTGTSTLTITVGLVPPPTTAGTTVQVPFGGTGQADLSFLASGSGVSSFRITTPALNGTVIINGTVATYTPNANFFGTDSFAFTATGSGGTSAPATVTFVVATPGAPTVAARTVTVPFNGSSAIDLTSAITGVASTIAISTAPTNGTVTVSGKVATYRAKAGYFGPDSFAYTATGPGGTSMPATVSITVSTQAPSVVAVKFAVPINAATDLDLAPFIGGSGITGVRVMVQPKFGSAVENGMIVRYTPAADYFGDDSFSYMAFGNTGTSGNAVVTITIVGRPDPTKNANVGGIVRAQEDAAQRFASAQIGNFQSRLESLHRQKEILDLAPTPPNATTATKTAAAPLIENAVDATRTGMRTVSAPIKPTAASAAQAAASSAANAPLAKEAIGLLATGTLNVASVVTAVGATNAPNAAVGATNFWAAGTANFGQHEATGTISGSEFTTNGVSFGVDRRVNDSLVLGAGAGFGRDRTDVGSDGSKSKARGFSLVGYGSYQPSRNTFIDGLIGVGSLNFTSQRFIPTAGVTASGERDGRQVFGSVSAGYEKRDQGVLLSPYARLDFVSDRFKAGTETGVGPYALAYDAHSVRSLQGVLGFRGETVHKTEYGWASPRARLEYRHEFQGDRGSNVSYADLTGGPRYAILSEGVRKHALAASIGSDFQFKRGLTVGLDYQVLHTFNKDSSQGLRLTVTQPLDGRGNALFLDAIPLTFGKPQDIQLDAGIMFDDNVTRAKERPDKRSDRTYSANASKGFLFTFNDNARSMVTYSLGGEKFDTYKGLDRAMAGIEADVKYRTSAAFDALTYSAFLQVTGEQFQSFLRRGYRASAGFSARQQLTDRVGIFGALTYNQRWAKSAVFDNRFSAIRLNADYAWNNNDTVYMTGEFRKGHIVSTGTPSLENLDVSQVFVVEDAYPGAGFTSYRFEGNTVISTIGYNMGFGPRHSLDLSWRRAQSTPDFRPSYATTPKSYIADQYSVVYLIRF